MPPSPTSTSRTLKGAKWPIKGGFRLRKCHWATRMETSHRYRKQQCAAYPSGVTPIIAGQGMRYLTQPNTYGCCSGCGVGDSVGGAMYKLSIDYSCGECVPANGRCIDWDVPRRVRHYDWRWGHERPRCWLNYVGCATCVDHYTRVSVEHDGPWWMCGCPKRVSMKS